MTPSPGARLLPVFGAALFGVPLLAAEHWSTAGMLVYLVSVWVGLILCTLWLSRRRDP